jgi:histidinol-phosphatase
MILSGMTDLKSMLEVACEAAMLGGKRTLAYFNAGVSVETKASPVTIADRESELAIRARIKANYPEHSILGEEGGLETGNPDFKWIIDPLDGTKTFVRGVPLYGVLVGLEIEGEVVVGAMYLPAMNEMIAAATGLGCHWNGRPARVSKTSTLRSSTPRVHLPEREVQPSIRWSIGPTWCEVGAIATATRSSPPVAPT